MRVININGPINSGKTTVSRILAASLKNSLFIEVDELLSDEEQEKRGLDFRGGIVLRLERLDALLELELGRAQFANIIFAYPMSKSNYERWFRTIDGRAEFKAITLALDLDMCTKNRGGRELTEWEIGRIKEMYDQGYTNPEYSDFVVNNSHLTPKETAIEILRRLGVDG